MGLGYQKLHRIVFTTLFSERGRVKHAQFNKTQGFHSQFAFWCHYLLAIGEETSLFLPSLQWVRPGRHTCSYLIL